MAGKATQWRATECRELASILIIEDTDDTRLILGRLFSMDRHTVATAAHGRQALEVLASGFEPDLVLLDLMMPVMDGFGFLEAIRRDPKWMTLASWSLVLMAMPVGSSAWASWE